MNQSIFGATERKNESIVGCFFGQVGKVGSIPLTSVASANEENTGECSGLGGFNDLSGQGQDDAVVCVKTEKER